MLIIEDLDGNRKNTNQRDVIEQNIFAFCLFVFICAAGLALLVACRG